MPFELGERIADRFVVRSVLGKGRIGTVFMVDDEVRQCRGALKVTHTDDPMLPLLLQREIDVLQRVNHPHIADCYAVGELPTGERYMAMELIEGVDASRIIAAGVVPLHQALQLGQCVAGALATAHEAGVIHCDIKPGNIMVPSADGVHRFDEAKVIDFGMAAILRVEDRCAGLTTRIGRIAGSIAYMAPEQLAGRRLTTATDVFGLGVVLYELIIGHPPMAGTDTLRATLEHHNGQPRVFLGPFVSRRLSEDVVVPTDAPMPFPLRELLEHMMRCDPRERCQSMADVGSRLLMARLE